MPAVFSLLYLSDQNDLFLFKNTLRIYTCRDVSAVRTLHRTYRYIPILQVRLTIAVPRHYQRHKETNNRALKAT